MALFGSILKAVAGPLIGGMFGKKSEPPPPPEWKPIDYKKLRKAARRGGFNPLTALQNGGGMAGAWSTEPAALSSNSFIGEALASGFRAWAEYDPLDQKRAELEVDLMQAELDRMNREATEPQQGFAAGTMVAQAPQQSVIPDLRFGGGKVVTADDTSNAGDYEERYGEIGGSLIGIGVMARDAVANALEWASGWEAPPPPSPSITRQEAYPGWMDDFFK